MVKKPTRFLTKNRLNVALSRVRQKLYILADQQDFVATKDEKYLDCYQMIGDLLRMPFVNVGDDEEDDDGGSGGDIDDDSSDYYTDGSGY
jgi:hypothetical protein